MADAIVSVVLEQLASIARQQIQQEVTLVWGVNKERAENALTLKKKVCSFFLSPCFCFRQVVLHHDIAVKIKEINENLDDIAKEKDRYNFNMAGSVEQHQRVETTSLIDESKIFGRDKENDSLKNVDEAVEKLKAKGIVCYVSNAQQRKNLIDKTVQKRQSCNRSSGKDERELESHCLVWSTHSLPFRRSSIGVSITAVNSDAAVAIQSIRQRSSNAL
ncbi:hypothetical protein EZV62_028234 [Acer yangbiense]|uniref:Uncharacterized protein n=1 Tax=Acer yangbiense TaxID=1000413 RepID=A0A5C7GN89_9ROSI|nr:hypothetical protein EZV62_028234 [Acer yangbiense]